MNIKLKKNQALILKSLPANMRAYNDFLWPDKGIVSAPDWKDTRECGNGLHGWLWGEGNAELRCPDSDAKWIVVVVDTTTIIDLKGKVKFPSGNVVFCGDCIEAVSIIQKYAPEGNKCIFGTATAGYRGTATAGDRGTATAGDRGTATAGYSGTATAGDSGTATAGIDGFICIEYYDNTTEKFKKKMAYIDGVEYLPGIKYRLNSENNFEAVKED